MKLSEVKPNEHEHELDFMLVRKLLEKKEKVFFYDPELTPGGAEELDDLYFSIPDSYIVVIYDRKNALQRQLIFSRSNFAERMELDKEMGRWVLSYYPQRSTEHEAA